MAKIKKLSWRSHGEKEVCVRTVLHYFPEFVGIKKMELTSFIAVMRLVKLEYSTKKPELFKMLISILHDYDPSLGTEHFQKVNTEPETYVDKDSYMKCYL